ncbi:hypothetical protein PCI56_10150 [Plesiomonas shigelloides subsp. oncorhynchi]|nr:hypothetical protein [Plesiomonas shigelloides]
MAGGWQVREKAGWWHVGIKGEPYARGFQYGYLIAPDFKSAWKGLWSMTYLTSGVPYHAWKKAAIEQTEGRSPPSCCKRCKGGRWPERCGAAGFAG